MYKDRALPIVWTGRIKSNVFQVKADILNIMLTSDNRRNKMLYDDILKKREDNDACVKIKFI